MKKTLRFLMLTALMVLAGNVMAEETTIDFAGGGAVVVTATDDGFTYTVDPYTFTAVKNNGSTAPTQNGNYFDVRTYAKNTLTISTTGDAMKQMTFTLSYNGKKRLPELTVSTGEVSYDTSNGIVTWTYESGATEVSFTVGDKSTYGTESGKAGQFDFDKVVINTGEVTSTKSNAGLSWSATTAEAQVGEAFTAPTLSNPNGLAVTYSSSNESVATIDANGNVTIVAAGETTITATSEETDDYYAGEASYTLTVSRAAGDIGTVTLDYTEAFSSSKGEFYTEDVSLDSITYVWTFDSKYGMKASAYVNKKKYASESWLISPYIDMTSNTGTITLTFEQAARYFGSAEAMANYATLWVRVKDGEWSQLTIESYPDQSTWDFQSSGEIDLSAYAGKVIQIGFKYTSDSDVAGTWEIKNFSVKAGESTPEEITYTDMTIAECNEQTANVDNINLVLNNAVVTYVDGNNIHVREGDKAIIFYNTGLSLTVGDVLNGSIKMNYVNYYGIHEVKAITDVTTTDELTISQGEEPEPTVATVEEVVATDHVCDYIIFKSVYIVSEDGNYYASDGTNKVQLYKGIDVSSYADDGNLYDITGLFNNIYKGENEVKPLTVTLATTTEGSIYIVGNDPFGGWDPANGTEMTSAGNGVYTYTFTYSGVESGNGSIWFVFSDGLDSDWDTFNGTYRFGPTSGSDEEVAVNTDVTTQKQGNGNGSYKVTLTAGNEYTITFTNGDTPSFKIEGTVEDDTTEKTYTVAGSDTNVLGTSWDPTNTANDMTKQDDGTYTLTISEVSLTAGSYEYKVCVNHAWSEAYPSSNASYTIDEDGTYTLVFTYDPTTNEVSVTVTAVTGINGITTTLDTNAPAYNVAGQRVGKSFKGVVIQNGKKFVVK